MRRDCRELIRIRGGSAAKLACLFLSTFLVAYHLYRHLGCQKFKFRSNSQQSRGPGQLLLESGGTIMLGGGGVVIFGSVIIHRITDLVRLKLTAQNRKKI
jgi:hypothetical protein